MPDDENVVAEEKQPGKKKEVDKKISGKAFANRKGMTHNEIWVIDRKWAGELKTEKEWKTFLEGQGFKIKNS
jgi:hypothetical protein